MDDTRRARLLIAAGITPHATLNPRAQKALDDLAGLSDDLIEAWLTLIHEGRQLAEAVERSNRLAYTNPPCKPRPPQIPEL